jgi:hypothetical protein
MRRVINLIHQGTSPIIQEQNGLPLVARSVEIGEKSRYYEEKLEQFTEPLDERARMLLGLAEALWSLHDSHLIRIPDLLCSPFGS